MFDPDTAQLLRSAPKLPDLDPDDIPGLLTRHYAELVSARLRGVTEYEEDETFATEWTLERIADTYELITSIHSNAEIRKASAFVAATAQQILARRQDDSPDQEDKPWNISRDRVDPTLSAALLFLAAEQYADANEATSAIVPKRKHQLFEVTILGEHIRDLASGNLNAILDRAVRWRKADRQPLTLELSALTALLEALICGIEILAAQILSLPAPQLSVKRFNTARQALLRVLELSSNSTDTHSAHLGGDLFTTYAGPRHLASLLLASYDGIHEAALTRIPPPDGANPAFWKKWILYRASKFPFVWPNHREAIKRGFYQTGNSAVMVLPTGAGKTTVSSLKIAGVLARGKKVVFLAPTHALVDQLTDDLQKMFPKDLLGSVVSSDFDLLLQLDTQLKEIEVMTPERCLAILSFAPEAFGDVGLLVFDECHLLSPQSGKIRRALDGMLCVLAFNQISPEADILFMSAMLKNGEEFSKWVGQLTGRYCVFVDLLWKPSRQARGVVIYKDVDLQEIKERAEHVQEELNKSKNKLAKSLRSAAARELKAHPYAVWGLQHNWLSEKSAFCIFSAISDNPVTLTGDINQWGKLWLKPNANHVAAGLAVTAAKHNLKTIVFVNQKAHAVATARNISEQLNESVQISESERERWEALKAELGDLKHSILDGPSIAVPHNASMLRLERNLAEQMFCRQDGAKVIVATPTLAQGLNLPAHLAILAGDKRADADEGGREELEAHEILNAAARAGRAGHLANGVVLLIPEPILSFPKEQSLDEQVVQKLQSVLPEDDRCMSITDPLQVVLDRLMQGQILDPDVQYMINRMAVMRETEGEEGEERAAFLFSLNRSLAAYAASQNASEAEFEAMVEALKKEIEKKASSEVDAKTLILASQSGLSTDLLLRLKQAISEQKGSLPVSVEGWVSWTINWLILDTQAQSSLLFDVKRSILAATGFKKDGEITSEVLEKLLPGVIAWISGEPLCNIEKKLGGNPDFGSDTNRTCPRARDLVGSVIPRGLSFIMGLVSQIVEDVDPFDEQEELSREVVECLGTAVRKGFDNPQKLTFAMQNANILSRVVIHRLWDKQI
jgi:superfamily II DNA/RNA helicase